MRKVEIPTESEVFDLQIGDQESTLSHQEKHSLDIMGYVLLENLLNVDQVRQIKEELRRVHKCLLPGVRLEPNTSGEVSLLNIVEAGGLLEETMALPRVLEYVRELIWGQQHRLIRSRGLIRERSSCSTLNQGGKADPRRYTRYRCAWEGQFRCLLVTCLMALSESGPGKGPFCLIPGSHKSNLPHPYERMDVEQIKALREISLQPGSGILFTENLSHAFKSPTYSQVWLEFQYGPSYMVSWPGSEASPELLRRTAGAPEKAHLLKAPYYHPVGSQKKRKS